MEYGFNGGTDWGKGFGVTPNADGSPTAMDDYFRMLSEGMILDPGNVGGTVDYGDRNSENRAGSQGQAPVGGWVKPTQTYTGHTGYDRKGNGDGVFTNTPTGGGVAINQPEQLDAEKIFARPDLQGTGREAFQASQFASAPPQQQGPQQQGPQQPSNPPNPNLQLGAKMPPYQQQATNPTADANARAQSLRNFDESRQRMGQQNLNAQSGNNAGTSMGPASPIQFQGVN
jgi:hypothetical protein